MRFVELILSCWINTDPDLLFVPDPPNSIPLVVETKSKNRVLAACMPRISEPAERGTLECSDATEDHFSPSGWMIWGCGCRWQWVEAGSPLMQVCFSLAAVHRAKLVFPFQPSTSTFPPLSICALQPDLHLPPGPCVPSNPSSPAAGWAQ